MNCRHQPFQGCALPTELPRHGSGQEERGTVTGSSEKNQAAWSVTFREPPKQIVAEREGFEPSVEVLPLRRFSKPLPSATRPPLHWSQLYAASGTVMQTGQYVDGLHLWHNIDSSNTFAGCSKRPFSKAATSEEATRTLRYVEPLRDARTLPAAFFSILLCGVPDDLRQRSMTEGRPAREP